jgi:NADH:ubiquinone oxidoreductase subunit 3 (subunit A)
METGYLSSYFPIIIFLGIAMVLSCLMVAAAWLVGKQKPDAEKNSAYECGFPTFSDSRHRFEVRYYLVPSSLSSLILKWPSCSHGRYRWAALA